MEPVDMAKVVLVVIGLYAVTSVFLIYWCVVNNDRPDGIFRRAPRDTKPTEGASLTE